MIFTFYSYKGGVGRSMALANIAEAFYNAGFKVLMVDWDLEAPGLERFFEIDYAEAIDKPGIVDLLQGYKRIMSKELPVLNDIESVPFEKPDQFTIDIYPNKHRDGNLWLLSAGRRSEPYFANYVSTVLNFDWFEFYQRWNGELYFEWIRNQFLKMADIVLIDSRTGVTEMGGVCTYQLADAIIMFCAPNQQNIYGINEMAQNFKLSAVNDLRRGRPLDLIIVPARVEDRAETRLLNNFHDTFIEIFNKYLPERIGGGTEEFWKLKIPHVPYYAFNEEVAMRERGVTRSEDLVKAYASLARIISKLNYSYLADPKMNQRNLLSESIKYLRSQGLFARDAGDNKDAEELFTNTLELAKKINNKEYIIKMSMELAKLAMIDGKPDQAEKTFENIKKLMNDEIVNKESLNLYLTLANLAADLGKIEEAERYFDESIKLEIQSNKEFLTSKWYYELAKDAMEKNDHKKVNLYFNLIIKIYKNKSNLKGDIFESAQKDLLDLEKLATSSKDRKLAQLWLYLYMEIFKLSLHSKRSDKKAQSMLQKGFDKLQKDLGPEELLNLLNMYMEIKAKEK